MTSESLPPTSAVDRRSPALLLMEGVWAAYGSVNILNGLSLQAMSGEVIAIIGPNGAGKSTVLKTVMGFLPTRQGRVLFRGQEISGLRPDAIARLGIGYAPQGRLVFADMTVLENLEMGGFLEASRERRRLSFERVFDLFPILRDRRSQRASTLSGGEQQMLAIGRALMLSPSLLLLDEPSLGLDPRYVDLVFAKIQELKAAGMTMIIVEQNAARALAIADWAYVVELGQVRFQRPGRAMMADERVRRLYLGG